MSTPPVSDRSDGGGVLQTAPYGDVLPVCIHDTEGEIRDCTRRFVSMLGLINAGDLIGARLFDYYVSFSDPAHLISLLEVGSFIDPIDVCLRRSDGRLIWVLQMSCFTQSVGRPTIVTTFMDITERKLRELLSAERASAQAMLAQVIASDLLGTGVESIIAAFKSASEPLRLAQAETLPDAHQELSPRELRVLVLTGHGKSLKEIAAELGVSFKSVSTYRTRVIAKLGMKTTADLIAYVLRYRLK